jgi:hypothetical protein
VTAITVSEAEPFAGANEMTLMAVTRLRRALGRGPADRCAKDVLARLGLTELKSAADLLEFANCLLEKNGAAEMVGSALKVAALLRGARTREPPPREPRR